MRENHFPVPTVQSGMSEGDLDQYCRGYLQTLKNNNLVVSYFLGHKILHALKGEKEIKEPRYEVQNNLRALEIPLSHEEQLLVFTPCLFLFRRYSMSCKF